MKLSTLFLATVSLGLASVSALAAGDPALGEKVFIKCKACHDATAGTNKVGPTLKGLVGRPAGTVADYKYSDANKNSGLTWDEATLSEYLKDPKKKIPGTKMAFAGIKDQTEIDNLIAYLAAQK